MEYQLVQPAWKKVVGRGWWVESGNDDGLRGRDLYAGKVGLMGCVTRQEVCRMRQWHSGA